MSEKILITSALPYANGPLHFGHIAGAYLPGDCYARFQRLIGSDVLFLCGSDEYGLAITISAEQAGRTPQQQVDIYHAINKAFFEKLEFSFDHYSRTTWPGHVETVQQYFTDLLNNGYIEEKETDQLYSEKDKKFLADRYVIGICPKCGFDKARGDECPKCGASYEATDLKDPRSKVTGAPLIRKPTKHYFLRFDLFKDKLNSWLHAKNWKSNVINFAKGYIDDLRPRAITRDSQWGVPIPLKGTDEKVFYVWFDAPIGYISAAKDWAQKTGDKKAWEKYWCDPKTKLVHFIGKDNIPFHAVFFPAMTMGQNAPYKLVDELPANEFLNLEGRQFSKSEGWTIDLERFFVDFTPDQIRYYLAAIAPETSDSEFTWKDFQLRCNSELLGKWGNLANRTLVFAQKHLEGKMPSISAEGADAEFLEKIQTLASAIRESYAHFQLRKAAAQIMELASLGNVYFDVKKPWVLAKDESTHTQLETAIGCTIECLKALALVSSPIIPASSQKLWEMLGYTKQLEKQNWDKIMKEQIPAGTTLPEPETLFKRVEDEVIIKEEESLKKVLEKKVEENKNPLKPEIDFDTFQKVDLRICQILAVEPVPKSKKLLKLLVDFGFEKRTIVSGIAHYFEDPQTLVGKKVLAVVNLKPAKLMGTESQGMIVVADIEGGIELIQVEKAGPGSSVR